MPRFVQSEKSWAIRLLSIACLSLAAKMEECNVPGLSEFKLDDYSFEGKVIQKMELLVLSTLEWEMGIITPFDFLSYFITKFCKESPPSPIFYKTMQLIFTTMKGEPWALEFPFNLFCLLNELFDQFFSMCHISTCI